MQPANEVERSSAVEDVELASPPNCPGWPPAELPEHECVLPHVGLPHPIGHEQEDEN